MTSLKISAADWCFFRKTDDPAVYYAKLRASGCAAVEMAAVERWPAARAAGLDLLNLSGPGMCDGLNRMENRAKLTAEIAESIALAAANRVSQVIVFSGNRNGQDTREGFRNCRQALCELAPAASRAGVTLLFEMLNSIDHKDYQFGRTACGVSVVKGVGSPRVGILYDIYHAQIMEGDLIRTGRKRCQDEFTGLEKSS